MKHVLFICGRNKLRSPSAEEIFTDWPGIEVTSAGINPDCDNQVTPELLEWAELIFVMEKSHKTKLASRFRASLKDKRVICLDIKDKYQRMDPELIRLLKAKVCGHLPPAT